MPNHISQVNASRGGSLPAREGNSERRAVPGEVVSDYGRTRPNTTKPKVNHFNAESRKRAKMWEENRTASWDRDLEHERELGDSQAAANLESMKTAINLDALHQDAKLHTQIAQAIAKMKQTATAEAMHNGKGLTVYASNLIRFIDSLDGMDAEIVDNYKGMVRRLARGAMIDWESAALGVDFDHSTFGGLA